MDYKIVSKFIKDISFEIPSVETFVMLEKEISKYNLNFDIKSKPFKNNIIEVSTILKIVPSRDIKHKMLAEINLASLVSIAALMTLTTTPLALATGLERMLSPLKKFGFPAHEFAMMISISIRFIPVLAEEAERIRNAQLARGADFSGSLLRRAKKMVPVLVPLFQSAFERADHLAMAMESRCYQGGNGRTSYRVLAFSRSDLAASCVVATASLIMILRSGFHILRL